MDFVISAVAILITVAIAQVISSFVPRFPSNFISLGILFAIIPFTNQFVLSFNNDIFMLFILVPLLFFEGHKTPLVNVTSNYKNILNTAILLVMISAIFTGFLVGSMFGIIMSLSCVLVAISTPTDITAFESVIEGRLFPLRVKKELIGEALFNDATGIIVLESAIMWYATRHISITQSLVELVYSTLVSIMIGIIISLIFIFIRQGLVQIGKNEIVYQMLSHIFTPFIVYLIAEHIGVSGILAVVTAGIVHNSELNRSRFTVPKQIHLGIQYINVTSVILNSFVFVCLGISLERIINTQSDTLFKSMEWFLIGITIYLLLVIVRFIYGKLFVGNHSYKDALLFSVGGVHGAITLAMTFSIQDMVDEKLFSFIVIVETIVIIISMIVPTILFKLILEKDKEVYEKERIIQELRLEMSQVGINTVENMDISKTIKDIVIYDLKDQANINKFSSFFKEMISYNKNQQILTQLQSVEQKRALMYALDEQRRYLYLLAKNKEVKSEYVYEVYNDVLLAQSLVIDPQNQLT